MKKFTALKDKATELGITVRALQDQAQRGKIMTVNLGAGQQQLMIEGDNERPFTISLINIKGGQTKTTSSTQIATCIAKAGLRVLLIDMDPQNHCRYFFAEEGLNGKTTIKDLLYFKADIKDVIHATSVENLDIIMNDIETTFLTENLKGNSSLLKRYLEDVKNNYDFVIIDNHPSYGILTQNAIVASTHILVPVHPSPLGVDGLTNIISNIRQSCLQYNIKYLGIVPVLVDKRKVIEKNYMDYLEAGELGYCFTNFIPTSVKLMELSAMNTNIFDYQPLSKEANAYRKLTYEIMTLL